WTAPNRRRAGAIPVRAARTRSTRAGVRARSRPRAAPPLWRRPAPLHRLVRPTRTAALRACARARCSCADLLGDRPHGRERIDLDLAEWLILAPGRLPLLVQLQQREQRNGDRDTVCGRHRLIEAEAAAPKQLPQMRQPLGDRDLRDRDVTDVD